MHDHHQQGLPKGWWPLFERLVGELRALDPDFEITRAKQKFGTLRVYLERYAPGTHDLIDAATRESKKTCEICGEDAILRVTQGFYQTLCDKHRGKSEPAQKNPLVASFRFGAEGLKEVPDD